MLAFVFIFIKAIYTSISHDYYFAPMYMYMYIQHKARNLLKRVGNLPPPSSLQHSDDYCTACLLLAKAYVDQGKYALAQELCRKVLGQNKSSAQVRSLCGRCV